MQAHKRANTFLCMETLAHRIKAARKYASLTQKQLADAARVEQPLISQLETGKTLKTAFLTHIAKACRVSAQWLATGEGVMVPGSHTEDGKLSLQKPWDDLNESHANVVETHQPHRLAKEYPLISWVAAGSWQESCDNFQPGTADEWLLSSENAGKYGYWLEVKGPSMLPTFTPGMRILVRPEGFDIVSGKFYIARLDSGETTFKQFLRDGGQSYLQPLNPSFPVIPVDEGVSIIGQVVDAKLPPIF